MYKMAARMVSKHFQVYFSVARAKKLMNDDQDEKKYRQRISILK